MNVMRTADQEASEDVFFGQVVLVWARWFLIAAGAVGILTGLDEQASLIAGTIPIVLLMFMNLYLHGRYMMEKPVGVPIIMLTSLLDLVIITLLVAFLSTEGETPIQNQFFIFYYPMVLAFGFVMPRRIEIVYTVVAILLYVAVMAPTLVTMGLGVDLQVSLKTLLFRIIILGAMGGLGNYYWRIQRERRRAATAGANPG